MPRTILTRKQLEARVKPLTQQLYDEDDPEVLDYLNHHGQIDDGDECEFCQKHGSGACVACGNGGETACVNCV